MSADHICYYRDLSLGLHFLLTNSSISLFLRPSLYQWERRWDSTILDRLCHSYLLYFLCFRCPSSKQNLIFRCSDHSSLLPHLPGLLSTYFPSYTSWFSNFISTPLPSEWLMLAVCLLCSSCYCLVAFLSSLDCAMQCRRVKGRTLLLSWKILALTRSLDYDIW